MARPGTFWGALAGALVGSAALAQSAALLDQVRGHDPLALQTASAELKACTGDKGCADASALKLLTGYLALSTGDAEQAQRLLASAGDEDALAPFAAYYRGEAAFYAHQYDVAVEAWAEAAKTGPSWLTIRARHRQAEALIEAQKFALALPLLADAASGGYGSDLLWSHQLASRKAGDVAAADQDCHTLAVRWPRAQAGKDALAQIGLDALTPDERLDRAQALLGAGAAQDALEELEALEKAKLIKAPKDQAQVAYLREQAYYAQGMDKEGDHQAVLAGKGPAEIAAKALYARGRRALKRDDHDGARRWFARLDARFPKDPLADDAGYLIGWIDLQDGKLTRAAQRLGSFARHHPRSRKRDEALWFRALAQIELHAYGAARKTLAELMRRFPQSSLVPQALYWTHRCGQLSHRPKDEVAKGYAQVIENFPGNYYALLSALRMKELGKTPPPEFPEPPKRLEVPLPKNLSLAAALTRAGLFRDAASEIASQAGRVKDEASALALGHALQGLGNYGAAYSVAARLLWGAAFHDRKPEALALLFPRAFRPLVEKEAKAQDVDPALMWAVMRRESAFDPTQVSGANARGLLQLIPPTGAAIAKKLALPTPSADALLVPETNVKLSSWYLAQLVKRFHHPVLCAAAYNAGPSAVVRWVKEDGKLPLDLFVEQIPYKETRGYVKQVAADLYNYHALYGGDALAPLSLTLPTPDEDGVRF